MRKVALITGITGQDGSYLAEFLIEKGYAASSINSMLASLNSLLDFLGWSDCKVKNIKTQRQTYCAEEKELTKSEYLRCWRRQRTGPSCI